MRIHRKHAKHIQKHKKHTNCYNYSQTKPRHRQAPNDKMPEQIDEQRINQPKQRMYLQCRENIPLQKQQVGPRQPAARTRYAKKPIAYTHRYPAFLSWIKTERQFDLFCFIVPQVLVYCNGKHIDCTDG